MKNTSTSACAFLALASLFSTACAGSPESGAEEDVATIQQEADVDNGLQWNGLIQNGLIQNGLIQNGLIQNGLIQNGLIQNGLVMTALTDPMARMFFKYVASCALRPDQKVDLTIDGVLYSFPGGMGLAPEWAVTGGTCDATCRAWVSGCVLSRVNYLGEHIPLSVRGHQSGLGSDSTERSAYPNREATYYGDVFAYPQKRFVCKSPGSNLIARSCGPDPSVCIIKVVGNCDQVCDAPDDVDGSYGNCRDDQSTIYPGSVTVFRLP